MKYFLIAGEAKFAAGNSVPVYDAEAKAWRTDAGTFLAASPHDYHVVVEAEPTTPPTVTPIQFELLWTITEQLGIDTLRKTDALIEKFMSRVESPKLTEVDLSLQSTQDAVGYSLGCLASAGYIAADTVMDRYAQILTGNVT